MCKDAAKSLKESIRPLISYIALQDDTITREQELNALEQVVYVPCCCVASQVGFNDLKNAILESHNRALKLEREEKFLQLHHLLQSIKDWVLQCELKPAVVKELRKRVRTLEKTIR